MRNKLSETHAAIKKIRTAREQINRVTEPMKGKDDMKDVNELSKSILDEMKKIEEALYQTKNRSGSRPAQLSRYDLTTNWPHSGSEVDGK
ncbi:MAG: hypothetical protein U5K54_30105 [Cytophagales bacterium]|nr:hypothetical protein [Cytophagales bacterium]